MRHTPRAPSRRDPREENLLHEIRRKGELGFSVDEDYENFAAEVMMSTLRNCPIVDAYNKGMHSVTCEDVYRVCMHLPDDVTKKSLWSFLQMKTGISFDDRSTQATDAARSTEIRK